MTRLLVILNVAFNKCVKKVLKRSFNKTIDVQFGIYTGEDYKGWLTINLKPSHGWRDWLINLFALPLKVYGGTIHSGYWKEIGHYFNDFSKTLDGDEELVSARGKGIIISGRSKGGAEALLIGYQLKRYNNVPVIIGAIEPPMCVSCKFGKRLEQVVGEDNILWTCYKNDIVPGLPKWFDFPGVKYQLGDRRLGLSFKDHKDSTTDYDLIRAWIE